MNDRGHEETRPVTVAARVSSRIPDEREFRSPLHSTRLAALLGSILGVTFTVCFVTGLISHLHQHPLGWLDLPPRPAGLYRFTQSLHVATGVASIPLLLAKLWTVYPLFWTRPAVRNATHGLERVSLIPLVGGALFLLFTGVANIAYWYTPMGFFFTSGHFWAAWVTIGALVVHVGAKASITRLALSSRAPDLLEPPGPGLRRRGFLATIGATTAVLTVATVGQTIGPLRRLSVLAPRLPNRGPQGYPVNKSFPESKIDRSELVDGTFMLSVEGNVATEVRLSLDDLRSMPQHSATLPIQCVEGWSYSAKWTGVRLRDLLDRAGSPVGAEARVESLQKGSQYRTSPLNHRQIGDDDTLLALQLDGETLALDHGYPLRLIAPNRPGVQQTKWVTKVVVL